MTIARAIRGRTFWDYYMDCGPSANFIAISCILFLWIAFICCLQRADGRYSRYVCLLVPSSILPIVIGTFGSSYALYQGLDFIHNQSKLGDPALRPEEWVIPLIAGSLFSAIFIFLTILILAINYKRNPNNTEKATEQAGSGNGG